MKKKTIIFLIVLMLFPKIAKCLTTDEILQAAKKRADYISNKFTYGDAPINPAFDDSAKKVSCDRFVGWVLYDLGWTDQRQTQGFVVRDTSHPENALPWYLEQKGFTKITNYGDIEASDIIFYGMSGQHPHVFIVGNHVEGSIWERYDAGSNARINFYGPYSNYTSQPFIEPVSSELFSYAYRFPSESPNGTNYETDSEELGLLQDPAKEFPSLSGNDDFNCTNVFYNNYNEETNIKILLDGIFTLFKIAGPILAIAFSILDYMKALLSDTPAVKKVNTKLIKRTAIAIGISFLPFLIDLLFNLFGLYDIGRCSIGG